MPLGSKYDDQIVRHLRLGPETTTRLAAELKVDDGELVIRLFDLDKAGRLRITGTRGHTLVWELTEAERQRL